MYGSPIHIYTYLHIASRYTFTPRRLHEKTLQTSWQLLTWKNSKSFSKKFMSCAKLFHKRFLKNFHREDPWHSLTKVYKNIKYKYCTCSIIIPTYLRYIQPMSRYHPPRVVHPSTDGLLGGWVLYYINIMLWCVEYEYRVVYNLYIMYGKNLYAAKG